MRSVLRVLLACALAIGAFSLVATPAAAAPSFTLTRQTPWTLLEGAVALDLAIIDSPLDATVTVTIYSPVGSRTAFDLSIEGENLGPGVVHQVETTVGELPAIGSSERRLELQLRELEPEEIDPEQVPITQPGVYPVELVLDTDEADDDETSFVTHLVVVDGDGSGPTVGERLGVAWVWPLDVAPTLTAEGELAPAGLAELEPDGRLGRQVTALAESAAPVTVVPGGFTTEQWVQHDLTTTTGLRSVAAAPNQVLAGGYVPLDLPSLLDAGLDEAATAGRTVGTAALETALESTVDERTAIAVPIDEEAFAALADAEADRLVVEADDLEPVAADLTPARPFELSNGALAVLAAAPDPGLVELLEGSDAPALRAQQFLAALALVASEAPTLARGLVVVNPHSWDPEPEFLAAALAGLEGHPLLEPMTLEGFFETVPVETDAGEPLERSIDDDADDPSPPPVSAEAFRDAERSQESFRSLAGPLSPRLIPGDRGLLVALASTWGSNSAEARRQLGLVEETLEEFLGEIRVPVDSSITLTARTGSIPLAFLNETGQEVTVRVSLASERLDFPEGATRDVVLPPRASTESFEVETRTSGRFPVVLTVSSPDGQITVSSTRVDVRSTAVSGVGVFLTAGAGIVLAGWWFNDLRKRRKVRRSTITPSQGPDSGE